jgi:hypothetical protein
LIRVDQPANAIGVVQHGAFVRGPLSAGYPTQHRVLLVEARRGDEEDRDQQRERDRDVDPT